MAGSLASQLVDDIAPPPQVTAERTVVRLLLVEDDVESAAILSRALTRKLHDVATARDGRDALDLIEAARFDAIILDRRLPLIDGMEVLKHLRNQDNSVPVIVLSALGDLRDKVDGLNAGADDYLVKPVEIEELDARLKALGRRPPTIGDIGVLRAGTIEINLLQHKITRGGVAVSLLPLEMEVLAVLVRNAHQIVTRAMLLKEVWGYDFDPATNIVESKIARIRARLNFGDLQDAIVTVRGAGYMIREGA